MNSPAAPFGARRRLHARVRPALSLALLASAIGCVALTFTAPRFLQADEAAADAQHSAPNPSTDAEARQEPADVAAFRQAVGGSITPLVIELKGEPGVMRKLAAEREGQVLSVAEIGAHSVSLYAQQNQFIASLTERGVRVLPRTADVTQVDGSVRHIEYRFTYLLNGFVAYVATDDIAKLRALPEVAHISEAESPTYFLDKGVDYILGTQPNPPDRRTAVYGATQEFTPRTDVAGHPEAPRTTKVDGYEGQNINIAIIDSGVDYRHPMFGGTGQTTPFPRVSGQPESPTHNQKVIYFYAFSQPIGDPTDDFGHGTHVASTAAGFEVNGNTPPRPGFGTGRDGTGVGPTLNNEQLFGTAPQAKIMAYKVCGPATACAGDIPLAIEDAASPVTLVSTGSGGPQAVPKPVADVINLSLGSTAGDPAAANSRAANNAALAGTIVVASAGNSGPGLGTVGNPGAATLAISVAAGLDPGSVAVSDVLAPNQIPGETRAATAGPPAEKGAASNANAAQPGERQGMKIFPVAGGGPIPDGSISAHYVFVDRRGNPPPPVPASVTNRIAVVKGAGTFAQIANPVALQNPAAILIITSVESATAVAVVNGIPTFTIGPSDGNYLLDRLLTGDPGDGNDDVDPPNGSVSELPLRLAEESTLATFQPGPAGFSSRGPNDHPNASFRTVKPDVIAPGVGVVAAATVEGIPEETIGMASTTGYVSANGTSMASPMTAGAMALIRQRVREQLNLDTTNLADPQYRTKRFDTVTVARALLQNSATNVRSGFGVPLADNAHSINEIGAGLVNITDALNADAIMVSPTFLLRTPAEYSPTPTPSPAPSPAQSPTPFPVLIPTASYGAVPVVRLNDTIVRTREVIIRDVMNGAGGGTYNLSVQNNRHTELQGFQISLVATADSTTPITSVDVPPGGQASYFVRVAANGTQLDTDPTEFQWFVTATHASSAKKLRMPFYFRAVTALFPNSAAPVQLAPGDTETPNPSPVPSPNCPQDNNGSYTVKWTYAGPDKLKFRVQEATKSTSIFFDNADEELRPTVSGTSIFNENSRWRDAGIPGTPQTPPTWVSAVNPDTGSLAYFIPDAAGQNHSLTMKNPIALPPTGITLTFTTRGSLDTNFDFGFVEVSTDGLNYFPVLSLTGNIASGTREVDLSAYSGESIRLRFRLLSPQGASASPGTGWWVENIRILSDNFRTIAEPGPAETSFTVTGRPDGTYYYRVAAMYPNPNAQDAGTIITGPYSNTRCVTVSGSGIPAYSAQLLNISTRLRVQTGDNVGIAGLISAGSSNKRVIFRAIGPSLTANGAPVEGRLEDPVLELYDANGQFITSNDNWKDTQQAEIAASGLAPTDDREAAIARTLPPSAYTAIIRGKNNTTGIGVVEAYDRDANIDSRLANISTRGVVETGNNVLIGGFITGNDVGPIRVVVRALGPSLSGRGVPNSLQDPTMELYNQNGEVIASNDDWTSSAQRAEIESRGLAPQDNRESAMLQQITPGNYTAIVRGKNDSTGVGLVEVYNLP